MAAPPRGGLSRFDAEHGRRCRDGRTCRTRGAPVFDLPWLQSILLGAVVSSTDAAAVFATLRSTDIRRRLARVLEAETGLNDPVAIALTLGLITWIQHPESGFSQLVVELVRQLGLGVAIGVAFAVGAGWLFARLPESIGAFAPVASVAAAALAFGATDIAGGSGFVAVYLVGLSIGSTPSRYRHQIVTFHEGLAFLAQVALFIVFGLLVFPHELGSVVGPALGLDGTAHCGDQAPGRVPFHCAEPFHPTSGYCSVGPDYEAPPIVLATLALSAKIFKADTIFNAVFFVVVASTLLQGTTLEPLARRLHLVDPRPISVPHPSRSTPQAPSNLPTSTWPATTPSPASQSANWVSRTTPSSPLSPEVPRPSRRGAAPG